VSATNIMKLSWNAMGKFCFNLDGGIPTPLKNMSSSVGVTIPNIWKIKNVWNHQPDMYNSGSYKQNWIPIIVTKNNHRNAIIIIINHVDSFHFLPAPYDPYVCGKQ
jgi:hypothetical protein